MNIYKKINANKESKKAFFRFPDEEFLQHVQNNTVIKIIMK